MIIALTFTLLGFVMGILYYGQVYKHRIANIIEAVVYFNLVTLAVAAQASLNSNALVYSMVSLIFCVLICLCGYQFYVLYITKKVWWLKLKEKLSQMIPERWHKRQKTEATPPPPPPNPSLN